MGIYTFALVLGGLGLLLMALGGLFGDGQHSGDGHHVGDGHGHDLNDASGAVSLWSNLASLLSPRLIFSLLVGFGLTGLFLEPILPSLIAFPLAVAGGYFFERVLVGPVWRLIFRFESRHAETVEQMIMESGVAATSFDVRGDGLIRFVMNGENHQMLAHLRAEDRGQGIRVRAGDRIRIEEVDTKRNLCVVSWIGPAEITAG